jgi:hypothetical protein
MSAPVGPLAHWALETGHVAVIAAAFAFYQAVNWATLRFAVPSAVTDPVNRGEWATRVASSIHAVFSFVACARIALDDPALLWGRDPVYMRHEGVEFVFMVTIGYFISDFLMVIVFAIPPMWHSLMHHAIGGIGLSLSTASGGAYAWFGFFMLINAETTTPFNNHAWFVRQLGGRSRVAEMTFTTNWFLFRCATNALLFQRLAEHHAEFFGQHWILVTAIASNILFLVSIHVALAVFSLINPQSDMALPMPEWYRRSRASDTGKSKKCR